MTTQEGPSLSSVVVALDGEAKCGKTTVIDHIAEETLYQLGIIPDLTTDAGIAEFHLTDSAVSSLKSLQAHMTFNAVTKISAGNMYRAVALYKSLLELGGTIKTDFEESDTDDIGSLLEIADIKDVLQSDPNVAVSVTPTAKLAGVHALCGAIFTDSVVEAYYANGGANFIIVDARDPIGHLRRNGVLGKGEGQIDPASILPIYVDTTPEVAAARMAGDFDANLAQVVSRRLEDATRAELPVVVPTDLYEGYSKWIGAIFSTIPASRDNTISPYRLPNGDGIDLSNVQFISGHIAILAQELGHSLFHSANPDAPCWEPNL